jgi:hypothetical protein
MNTNKIEEVKQEVYVIYDEVSTGGEPESDSKYCNYTDEYTDFSVKGVFIGENQGSIYTETCKVDFDPDKVSDVYVVYGIYSTGDTFGSSYGKGHIVGVYDSYTKAKQIVTLVREIYKLYEENANYKDKLAEWAALHRMKVKDVYISTIGPWHGYFESLEDVKIEVFPIKKYK